MRTKEEIMNSEEPKDSLTPEHRRNAILLKIAEALLDTRDIFYAMDERLVTLNNSAERIADRLARRNS